MEDAIAKIYDIIKDYRNEDGIRITKDSIREWAMQFGEDAEFMVSEMAHLLPQVYFSKERVRITVLNLIAWIYKFTKQDSFEEFLKKACFMNCQPEGKSQGVLVGFFDDYVLKKTGRRLSEYSEFDKSIYIYLDDVLATGNTISTDIIDWIRQDDNLKKMEKGEIRLFIPLICVHRWGYELQKWRLSKTFPSLRDQDIVWVWDYEIQNHLKFNNQSLNIAIPVKDQPKNVYEYLNTLEASKYEEYAFRPDNKPFEETFFTSPENRIRYEYNLLQAGLKIISKITSPVNSNIRPLGFVNPNYKILGIGTHFITWRNIPNNSPLALWWDVSQHGWKPLFPPRRSGVI